MLNFTQILVKNAQMNRQSRILSHAGFVLVILGVQSLLVHLLLGVGIPGGLLVGGVPGAPGLVHFFYFTFTCYFCCPPAILR